MSVPKPQLSQLINPGLPRGTRVMIDGQEGHIVDHTHSRPQRLILMRGSVVPAMTSIYKITHAWPGGQEHAIVWNPGKSLEPWSLPLLRPEQQAD